MSKSGCQSGYYKPVADFGKATPTRSIPAVLVGKDIAILDAGAGLGHHAGDGVAPGLVVGRFFVAGRVVGRAIDLDEDKPGGIVLLLNDVKAGDAWLLDAVAGVFNSGSFEGIDLVGFDVDKNVYDIHANLQCEFDGISWILRLLRIAYCV